MKRILQHLDLEARSPVDRFTLLRVTGTPGDPPSVVLRALEALILHGDVRTVGDLYIRVPAAWPTSEARVRPPEQRSQSAG